MARGHVLLPLDMSYGLMSCSMRADMITSGSYMFLYGLVPSPGRDGRGAQGGSGGRSPPGKQGGFGRAAGPPNGGPSLQRGGMGGSCIPMLKRGLIPLATCRCT